jgi:hypothetical protein
MIVFYKTYMDVGSKNLFRDSSNVKNFKPNFKTEIGQKGRTFHFKKRNYVKSGTRQ